MRQPLARGRHVSIRCLVTIKHVVVSAESDTQYSNKYSNQLSYNPMVSVSYYRWLLSVSYSLSVSHNLQEVLLMLPENASMKPTPHKCPVYLTYKLSSSGTTSPPPKGPLHRSLARPYTRVADKLPNEGNI